MGGVRQHCGRRQVSHFAGQAESPMARQPRIGGVLWDIYGLKTSHFETFQSWTLRNVSHSETFEAWRPEKASHFESFRGWRRDNASHFESSGGCRLREVSHGEAFWGRGLRKVSHGEAWCGPCAVRRPWAYGASRAVGRGRICGRAGPLGLMVERRHEAWQGASVIKTPLPWARGRTLAKRRR